MTRTPDPWPGTLDLSIVRTLQKNALHGVSPALHRLEPQGWLEAEWQGIEPREWQRMSNAFAHVMRCA